MRRQLRRALTAAAALALGLSGAVLVAAPAHAAGFNVTQTGDNEATVGTLRWAVKQANDNPGQDTITIAGGVTPITLTAANGSLVLTEGVSIEGAFGTTIQRDGGFNMFDVLPNGAKPDQAYNFANLIFKGDGVQDGYGISAGTGTGFDSLSVSNAQFTSLRSTGNGSAVRVNDSPDNGPVSFSGNVVFGGNSSDGEGGAVFIEDAASVSFDTGTFSSNTSDGNGGAISIRSVPILTVTNYTFGGAGVGNSAVQSGGAIFTSEVPTVTLTDVTAIGNSTGASGGGGAVHIEAGTNATIDGGLYQDNEATASDGGAVRFYNVTSLISIEGAAAFVENKAHFGGAIVILSDTDPVPDVQIIEGSSFTGNEAANLGGAIYSSEIATFTTQDATYSSNEAGWSGGAIWQESSFSTFLAERSLFDQNRALGGNGGAIGLEGMDAGDHNFTLRASTFSGNSSRGSSSYGGALVIGETGNGTVVSVDSSTFVDNEVSESDGFAQGAAIAAINPSSLNGRLDIVNSTIQERVTEDSPFAIFVEHIGETGLLTVRNTTLLGIGGVLVDDNDGGAQLINSIIESTDLPGADLDGGNLLVAQYSLFTSAYDSGVIADETTNRFEVADMKLGTLQNNGGPTDTRLPANDSPAVNTGSAAIEVDLPAVDQRGAGFPRVSGSAMDIGAVEIQVPPLPATGSTIPLWIPIVGGVILLVGIAAIVFTVVSRRRLHAADAPAVSADDPTVPPAV